MGISILILSLLLSVYAFFRFTGFSIASFRNWHLLATSIILCVFIAFGELMSSFNSLQSGVFWHRLSVFGGVAAFYFMYRFIVLFTLDRQEEYVKSFMQLLLVTALSVLFAVQKNIFDNPDPVLLIVVYTALFALMMSLSYLLFEILHKLKKLEGKFSTKSFVMVMLPPIATMLFIITSIAVFSEFITNMAKVQDHPFIVFLSAVRIMFYLLLGISLAGFAYIGERIHNFYSPIARFIKSQKAAAKNAGEPHEENKGSGASPAK